MMALALILLVAEGRPVLYRARRIGGDSQEFTMYKFRTMQKGTATRGAITGSVDPRVHRIGGWLRRLKLDELPQLINVVQGDMAIVGPRPEDPAIVACHYTDWMRETLSVLPGLTSTGSLCYFADESSLPAHGKDAEEFYVAHVLPGKLALDLVYVRGRTFKYDVELIMRTFVGIAGWSGPFRRSEESEQQQARQILEDVGYRG